MASAVVTPYCGAPPVPGELMHRWNLDPILIVALGAAWAGYAIAARRFGWRGSFAFHLGWGWTALLLIGPLCPLSVALFSARVGQHMLLTMTAAPLVAFGLPRPKGVGLAANPVAAAALFAVALVYWHCPQPYALTFQSDVVYWLMHLSLYGSALWLWRALLGKDAGLARAAGGVGLAGLAMALVGAVLTFAPRALFAPHFVTPYAWGLTPLEDQQLGGVLMWVPAGLIMAGGLVAGLGRIMARTEPSARQAAA